MVYLLFQNSNEFIAFEYDPKNMVQSILTQKVSSLLQENLYSFEQEYPHSLVDL